VCVWVRGCATRWVLFVTAPMWAPVCVPLGTCSRGQALDQAMARGFKRNGSFSDEPLPVPTSSARPDFDAAVAVAGRPAYVRVADRPLKEQLKTPEFIYLFVFTIVHMVRRGVREGTSVCVFVGGGQRSGSWANSVGNGEGGGMWLLRLLPHAAPHAYAAPWSPCSACTPPTRLRAGSVWK
jgi:hypothetical protein